MEQMYCQAINLIDTLAQKQHLKGLSEFEYKLYEQLCTSMAVYFGGLKFAFHISAMKTEMECSAQEVEYLAFLSKQEAERLQADKAEREAEKKKEPPEEPTEV